ncbi:DUF427 domain-containing protein [Jannaschia pohangensis]|uniref:Uncharacterized conserved protein, DUF427 family n=1 Tax=Jannaschia pohangensis TaxID=390807 RepID=A0A1I3R8G2_9RHOB|nr:DUF427 domain-containing protein [Jannaschia pohangensis]SFJ41711.1 Uncharacterized conserved protein, DUF427 family [Jannaschia pohangensis]
MTLPPENVQTYPRPPLVEPVAALVEVWLGGEKIVSTTDAIRVCETHHAPTYYIPRKAIRAVITRAHGSSFCEWKGGARYWTFEAGGKVARKCAWGYPTPTQWFKDIAGRLAIYAGEMDECRVAGMKVEPQPGEFYGGWVTPNLRGRIKGGPGSYGW